MNVGRYIQMRLIDQQMIFSPQCSNQRTKQRKIYIKNVRIERKKEFSLKYIKKNKAKRNRPFDRSFILEQSIPTGIHQRKSGFYCTPTFPRLPELSLDSKRL